MQTMEKRGDATGQLDVALCGISAHVLDNLIPAILQVPRLAIRTAVTRDEAKKTGLLGLLPGCRFVDDVRRIPRSTELVVAGGPPGYNLEACSAAEAIGAATFIEKPLASHPMLPLPSGWIQVGYNLTFSSTISNLLSLKKQRGEIIYFRLTYNTNKPRSDLWGLGGTACSFMYAVACHPIHLAAKVFGFEEPVAASLVSRGPNVFLDMKMRDACGCLCVLSGHNHAPALEFLIEAHFDDGSRVKLSNLQRWRTSSPDHSKDELSGRRSEAFGEISTFDLGADFTGFVGQFHDVARRVGTGAKPHPSADVKSAREINGIIEKILKSGLQT